MLEIIDWVIIALYMALSLGIGLYYTRKAGNSTAEFFLAGRDTSWWLAGLSMVATTFASDTPLAVTEIVRKNGLSGLWILWAYVIGGMLTTFFFARLWRRSGLMTDVEFVEMRYTGPAAKFLRGFKAVYFGVFLNTVIMGWVNMAMVQVMCVLFNLSPEEGFLYMGLAMVLTTIYTAMSGIKGVLVTDAIQFAIAIGSCFILAYFVLDSPKIGGLAGLKTQLMAKFPSSIQFFPVIGQVEKDGGASAVYSLTWAAFVSMIAVQWWASWYPGSEPGGGGYIAQRMLSAKNERHSLAATLFFQVMNFAFRPLPWIVVALATLIIYPNLAPEDQGKAYVYAMRDFLPAGFKGLLLVAFFAAYMSTIATHLNWGLSYLINDLYRPFVKPEATEKHYVLVSRIMTFVLLVLAFFISTKIGSIKAAWEFVMQCGAGLGLVLIMRWYWWRVSAWSEIVATVTPFVVYTFMYVSGLKNSMDETTPYFITVAITTVAWVAASYLLPGTEPAQLQAFYNHVQPQGDWDFPLKGQVTPANLKGSAETSIGDKKELEDTIFKISEDEPIREPVVNAPLWALGVCWLTAVFMVYAVLFGLGDFMLLNFASGLGWLGFAVANAAVVWVVADKYKVFGKA